MLVERGAINKTKLSGWTRALASDVQKSFENVPKLQYVNLSQSTSDQMINGKYQGKKTKDDILKQTLDAINMAIEYNAKVIGVNAEDASRSDLDYLINMQTNAKDTAQAGSDTAILWVMMTQKPHMTEFILLQKKQVWKLKMTFP